MIIKPRVTEFNHGGTECTEDERTENYWGTVEGEPVCGKDHAALAKQLQIRVRRLALLELSGAGPSCWGRCERVDRILLEGDNRHRA